MFWTAISPRHLDSGPERQVENAALTETRQGWAPAEARSIPYVAGLCRDTLNFNQKHFEDGSHMRGMRKLIAVMLLAAVAGVGAPSVSADGPQESPGVRAIGPQESPGVIGGPQESPGGKGPQESPGVKGPQESPGVAGQKNSTGVLTTIFIYLATILKW